MFKVGDNIYCTFYNCMIHGNDCYEQIIRIGSKFIHTKKYKIDKSNMGILGRPGYSDIGKCYKSKEDYEEFSLANNLYNKLEYAIRHSHPIVDSNTIKKAAEMLGLDLKSVK